MLIRHADPQRDGPACAGIYAPYVLRSAISFEDVPPDGAEFTRRIEAISARFPWLVAEDGDRVVGYAYASGHRERAAYRWAAEAAVYVDESDHGRGVGRRLYEALFELLRRQGIRTVCAGVTLPNAGSVALHESVGFEPVGVYRRIGYKQGRWHDVGWWQLELATPDEDPPDQPGPPVRLEP